MQKFLLTLPVIATRWICSVLNHSTCAVTIAWRVFVITTIKGAQEDALADEAGFHCALWVRLKYR